MKIFVVNCGSSSIKYQLINMEDESVIAKGLVERIGIDGSVLTHTPAGKDKVRMESVKLGRLYKQLLRWRRIRLHWQHLADPQGVPEEWS